jgi:hypothetical protein
MSRAKPRGAAAYRLQGRLAAEAGRPWREAAALPPAYRRAWLAGWIDVAQLMARHPSTAKDFTRFHAKRPAAGAAWSAAELDLLAAVGAAVPRAPAALVAGLLGRSIEAVRSKASRCGYARGGT